MTLLKSYSFRRILHGLGMYLALVLAFSVVFQQVADRSLRAQAEEEVNLILHNAGVLDPQTYQDLKAETEAAKNQQYHLGLHPGFPQVLLRSDLPLGDSAGAGVQLGAEGLRQ